MNHLESAVEGLFFFAKRADGFASKGAYQFLEEWRLMMEHMARSI